MPLAPHMGAAATMEHRHFSRCSMPPSLSWLDPDDPFPDPASAWGCDTPAPGLLAAGGTLDVAHLQGAYSRGIFPWFSGDQPILWWAPDPRMVLAPRDFRLHRSLRKAVQAFRNHPGCEIRVDHAFSAVIRACAQAPRKGQDGTWIVPDMVKAYEAFHAAGYAHSVETWIDGQLVGGLYCVALGQAVFGESMFAHSTDASKIAMAALICICRRHQVALIDCQQNTRHLASLGAREITRAKFLNHVGSARMEPAIDWNFEPLYWSEILPSTEPSA